VNSTALFDLDGTLLDADHLHFQAWKAMLAPRGTDITVEIYRDRIMGAPNSLIMERFLPGIGEAEGRALMDQKEAMFRRLASELRPAPGLISFLDWLEIFGVGIGVVTNAPRANAEHELLGIGLDTRFPVLVIGEELPFSKPHPLPYLAGLKLLNGDATTSLAFEDSLSGITAARAAGLAVVGLSTGLSEERLMAEGVALAIPHFADPRLKPFAAAHLGI
jgi:HAD superfamily hydrolase (TIGR01509 family)